MNENFTMADKSQKLSENVPGKWYVDASCLDCYECREKAPNIFRQSDNGYSCVFRQPTTAEEEVQSQEALECCPAQAIGSDGD